MAKQDRPDEHRARRKDREASVVGSLSDMGVADLVQTLEMGRKSGVLHLKARTGARGSCWLRDGRVIDCELTGAPAGEEAFYRVLRWREGGFAIEFKPVAREERIQLPTQALLLQGMRRIDDWGRLVEQLPPLDRRLEVDVVRLGERLARLPDEVNTLLRLFDGRRTLAQVLEAAPRGDVATAEDVARLLADGILREPPDGAEPPSVDEAPAAAPPPEPGGVDWFAGPVGATAAAAPVVSWVPSSSPPPAAPAQPEAAGWLEPPLAAPPASPPPADRPRPLPRFSIPVPPPGSLPPPPSVAETLARYQVVPRPFPTASPQPVLTASEPLPAPPTESKPPEPQPTESEPPESQPTESQPTESKPPESKPPMPPPARAAPEVAADRPTAPRLDPAREDPRASEATSASEMVRRLSGAPPARRLDPASVPLHLEAPEAHAREREAAQGPRRSAAPYVALGLVVLAVVVGGSALTRRPVLRSPRAAQPEATATTPVAQAGEAATAGGDEATASAPTAIARPTRPDPSLATEAPRRAAGGDAPRAAAPGPVASEPVPARAATPARQPPAPQRPAALPAATAAVEKVGTPSSPPAAPASSVEPDPRKLLASADRKYAAGRYAEAIADYRRAIAQKPTPAAHVALARALYDAHRSAEALQELDGVDPRDASAWLLRGDIHQGEGRPAEAREAYGRFLELQPRGEQARTVRMILGREQQ